MYIYRIGEKSTAAANRLGEKNTHPVQVIGSKTTNLSRL